MTGTEDIVVPAKAATKLAGQIPGALLLPALKLRMSRSCLPAVGQCTLLWLTAAQFYSVQEPQCMPPFIWVTSTLFDRAASRVEPPPLCLQARGWRSSPAQATASFGSAWMKCWL